MYSKPHPNTALRCFLAFDCLNAEVVAEILGMNFDYDDDETACDAIADEIEKRYTTPQELSESKVFSVIVGLVGLASISTYPNYNTFAEYIADELRDDIGYCLNATIIEEQICDKSDSPMMKLAKCALAPIDKVAENMPSKRRAIKVDVQGISAHTKPLKVAVELANLREDEICDIIDYDELRKTLASLSDSELYEMIRVDY